MESSSLVDISMGIFLIDFNSWTGIACDRAESFHYVDGHGEVTSWDAIRVIIKMTTYTYEENPSPFS